MKTQAHLNWKARRYILLELMKFHQQSFRLYFKCIICFSLIQYSQYYSRVQFTEWVLKKQWFLQWFQPTGKSREFLWDEVWLPLWCMILQPSQQDWNLIGTGPQARWFLDSLPFISSLKNSVDTGKWLIYV